jgi:hypothetical protein
MIPVLIALAAGGWAAWSIYQFMPVEKSVYSARLSRVMAQETVEELPFWRAALLPFSALAQRLFPDAVMGVGRYLYWAQIGGKWLGWSEVEFWGLRLAVIVIGFAVGLLAGGGDMMIAAGVPGIALFWLNSRLTGPAKRAMRQVERELPEASQMMAMLVGSGKPLVEALRIIGGGKWLLAEWVRRAMAARPTTQPLLATARGERGFLREEAERSGLPALVSFAVQLDLLNAAGTGADILLASVAESVAADYRARLEQEAEKIGDKMIMPMMIFYFIPYLAGLLGPIILGNASVFLGG